MKPPRIAILTVSDGVANGARVDGSGDAIAEWVAARGYELALRATVVDESMAIAAQLVTWCDDGNADVVLTTGGTGLTMRDVTPEATRAVIERDVPGISEAIRARGAASTPNTWISRGVSGVRSGTLIVNLPGSTGGVRDGLAVLESFLDHAVQLLRGVDTDRHPATHG